MAAEVPSQAPQTYGFPLYPELPQSGSDLIPLPQRVNGPKLKPFDFQGSQQIEFLDYLGEGLHSHVIKVKILGQIYALKLFMFSSEMDWGGPPLSAQYDKSNRVEATIFCEYLDPFNNECRAFGRLHESGHPELAVECYGYVLLDEDHERALRDRFPGRELKSLFQDDSGRRRQDFLTKDGKPPPIRAVVKEFGSGVDKLRDRQLSKTLKDIIQLQELGIIGIDVAKRQLINGKLCDFSIAMTTPHFGMNPEMHPHLTPLGKARLEFDIFLFSVHDYVIFDEMVDEWNEDHRLQKDQVSVRALHQLYGSDRWTYNLRKTASRERVFTHVDPRLYDWRAPARGRDESSAGGQTNGQSSKGSGSGRSVAKVSKTRRQSKKPPRWYYEGSEEHKAKLRMSRRCGTYFEWVFKRGFFIPTLSPRYP
ncbi:unnamed protein product [Clonostachys rosea f. rosea IK726]|uniref:Uncharacterized protein n=1 Tax=Clonostachys rosea f. rosea IK726 TaxID=1349383 RepID=A0ACA9U9H4_BIOOC|nr:unnamed protein product [Clonostachys rosea f. rosea IK726]